MQIRDATADDIPLILGFIRGLAEYEKLLADVEATEASLARTLFPAEGAPAALCLLAYADDGVPAGFALYFFNYSTFLGRPGLYLEDIFVLPAYRRQGIGKGLLLRLAKLANERECGRMEWSVLDWNQPAIDFYKSLGAQMLTDWTTCRLTGEALRRYR